MYAMMKTSAMTMLFSAASRSCVPAFGPIHSARRAGLGHRVRHRACRASGRRQLIALALELDLDLVVARVLERSGCWRPCRRAMPRDAMRSRCLTQSRSGASRKRTVILSPPGLNFTSLASLSSGHSVVGEIRHRRQSALSICALGLGSESTETS